MRYTFILVDKSQREDHQNALFSLDQQYQSSSFMHPELLYSL